MFENVAFIFGVYLIEIQDCSTFASFVIYPVRGIFYSCLIVCYGIYT